jgi:cation:H+ antiporter
MEYLLLIIGCAILIAGANWLVEGASGLAKRFNVSNLVIGLTVVAFGTSSPELVVNLIASFKGSSEIALTNVIGSNIINVFVILGIVALISPVPSQRSHNIQIILSIIAALSLVVLGVWGDGILTRLDAVILLLFFSYFIYRTFKDANEHKKEMESDYADEVFVPMKIWKAILLIIAGLVALVGGGELIVRNAVWIARAWGVSEAIIGLTIVALGTSLPELATSAIAAMKKNTDLAIGNVIGSNIFNVFFVLGISAFVRELPAYKNMLNDSLFAALGSVLLIVFIYSHKSRRINRGQGFLLLAVYAVYLFFSL